MLEEKEGVHTFWLKVKRRITWKKGFLLLKNRKE